LSGSDIALVQGPPGTGKTTLICDLIARLLENDPFARVLIASQSHVAVDNVIEGLATRRPGISVVRIGREEKIGTISRRWRLEDRCRELAIEVTRRLGRQTAAIADNAPIDEPERELLDEATQTTNTLAASGWRLSEWSAFSAAVESRDWSKLRPLFRAPQVVDVGDAQRVAHVIAAVELLADRADARRELLSGMGQALADQAREAPPKPDHVLVPESDEKIVDDYVDAVSENPQLLADALVGSVSVVAGTCLGVVARRAVLNQQFDYVIVDEAGKATVLEAMVPLSLGRRVVLVGDQRQLPPTIEAELEEMAEERLGVGREELRKSLFQHLYEEAGDVTRIFLSSQHRMHPDIAEFISQEFYDGLLRSDVGEREMDGLLAPWWAQMVWLSTSAENDRFEQASGTSFRNPIELRAVIAALTELDGIFKNGQKHGSCGVLTGYRAQLDDLLSEGDRWQRRSSGRLSVEFGTVDAFQGREFDIVIYSITRANVQGRVGFLRDARRMNVALSRARHSVIVVGDHLFIRSLGRRAGALASLVEKLSAKGFKSLRPASGI
jgi:superfamily I DNA and/or RNA helicase